MEHGGDGQMTPLLRLAAGAGAGIVGMSATYPLDMVRGRLTVQSMEGTHRYRGILHAATVIVKEVNLPSTPSILLRAPSNVSKTLAEDQHEHRLQHLGNKEPVSDEKREPGNLPHCSGKHKYFYGILTLRYGSGCRRASLPCGRGGCQASLGSFPTWASTLPSMKP
jgi:hypothetical protein